MTASVSTQTTDGVLTMVITGEMDMGAGTRVEAEIGAAATTPDVHTIVIDLSQVEFLDSAGIATLVRGRRRADELEVGFRVAGASGMVRRVLDLTGVWDYLTGGQD